MMNPVKITPDMDQKIVLLGEKPAKCTVKDCSGESTAFELDAVEKNQDSFPKLYKAIYGGDARMHADYIYVGTEGEAIIELKHWKEFDEEKIKPAMEQIRETWLPVRICGSGEESEA